jgi:hypothetical protein
MKVKEDLTARKKSTISLLIGLFTIYLIPTSYLFENPNFWCIHKYLFHFDCPGCGMTRGLHLFLHGSIREACSYNMAILPFFLVVITYLLYTLSRKKIIFHTYRLSLLVFTTSILSQYLFKAITHFSEKI